MKKEKQKLYCASWSGGKDSMATILLALEHNEPLDRVVFSEVMFDHERGISGEIPEHIEWIYSTAIPKLEEMGVKVDVVRAKKDFVSLCRRKRKSGKNEGVPYGMRSAGFCYANSELKVNPVKQYYKQYREDYDIVQYVGIAIDEPIRLERLKGYQISLLAKYNYTEQMARDKCIEYQLLSPIYGGGGIEEVVGFVFKQNSRDTSTFERTIPSIGKHCEIYMKRPTIKPSNTARP